MSLLSCPALDPTTHQPFPRKEPRPQSLRERDIMMQDMCAGLPNVHFLSWETGPFDYVSPAGKLYLFLGTTLWSNVPEESRPMVQHFLNDYHVSVVEDASAGLLRLAHPIPPPVQVVIYLGVTFFTASLTNIHTRTHDPILTPARRKRPPPAHCCRHSSHFRRISAVVARTAGSAQQQRGPPSDCAHSPHTLHQGHK